MDPSTEQQSEPMENKQNEIYHEVSFICDCKVEDFENEKVAYLVEFANKEIAWVNDASNCKLAAIKYFENEAIKQILTNANPNQILD